MDRVVEESLKLPARVWRAYMAGLLAAPPAEDLARHGIPTLLVRGDRDAMFPRSEQEALLATIPGSELEVYRETGHAAHWERPEDFARDLEAFVTRVTR